jgi:hypothetical protein
MSIPLIMYVCPQRDKLHFCMAHGIDDSGVMNGKSVCSELTIILTSVVTSAM